MIEMSVKCTDRTASNLWRLDTFCGGGNEVNVLNSICTDRQLLLFLVSEISCTKFKWVTYSHTHMQ
jgi:hypothetical protein